MAQRPQGNWAKSYLRIVFLFLVYQHRGWWEHNWSEHTCYQSCFWPKETFILKSNMSTI